MEDNTVGETSNQAKLSENLIFYVDGEKVSFTDLRLLNADATYVTDSIIYAFTSYDNFDKFMNNYTDSLLKIKWEVAKIIRSEINNRGITDTLTSAQLIALLPKEIIDKYNIYPYDENEEPNKLLGFSRVYDSCIVFNTLPFPMYVPGGCDLPIWGWGVNLSKVKHCKTGLNWDNRISYIQELVFAVHGYFEHPNLQGQSKWFGAAFAIGNEPLIYPFFNGVWNNRISSIL